mgnify:CR=1 FL=1
MPVRKKAPEDLTAKKALALEVIDRLKKEYPDAGCTLDYDHAWQLLVSVRLAAQCTDARVNVVVQELFAKYDIPYEIRRTEIGPVVFDYRKEKNPCALCAKLRRGALHTAAQELGCNKVALGHHLDDAVETFYMNLWREGRIGCFSPVTYLSRRDLTLIRPMLLATEQEVISAVHAEGLPIVKSVCPADGVTVREQTKEFVKERCRTDHAFRQKTLHALQESGIDGWRPVHTGRGSFAITNEEE